MQQLGDHRLAYPFKGLKLRFVEITKASPVPVELIATDGFGPEVERTEQRRNLAGTQCVAVALDLVVDQGASDCGLLLALFESLVGELLKIGQDEEVDEVELYDIGVDVARHGQVEKQQRLAVRAVGFDLLTAQNLARCAGCADHYVDGAELGINRFEVDDRCAKISGERFGPRSSAVGNVDVEGCRLVECIRDAGAEFTSTDEKYLGTVDAVTAISDEIDGSSGD